MDNRMFINQNSSHVDKKRDEKSKIIEKKSLVPSSHFISRLKVKKLLATSHIPSDKFSRPVSFFSVKNKKARRFEYLNKAITDIVKEASQLAWITFSIDKIDFRRLKKSIVPALLSVLAYGGGEFITRRLSLLFSNDEEFDYIFKLAISAVVLRNSEKNCITDQQLEAFEIYSFAAAVEMLAIGYLYAGGFKGSSQLFDRYLSDGYGFLASLLSSIIIIPGGIAYYAQINQQKRLTKQYQSGAQRSDTTLISSGLTPVSNIFFQVNRILTSELSSVARLFQVGLISNNIISESQIGRQLRNFPSMFIDMVPQILRKLFVQLKKVEDDFTKNASRLYVLKQNSLLEVKRHELRSGDYVWCGKNFDFTAAPVSGEIIAFDQMRAGEFNVDAVKEFEYRVNLKNYSGENIWIKNKTTKKLGEFKEIDQRAIHDGTQLAILDGAEIDFLGNQQNFFVRVGRKKELLFDSSYEKKAVINQIITQSKQQNIYYAMTASILTASYLGGSPLVILCKSIQLLFSLFQMMIPFSEAFLREMINSKMTKELNTALGSSPLDMIDALRVADLLNAFNGYYADKFPKGVVVISDKTGTLTTTRMQALGIWTPEMKANVQEHLTSDQAENKAILYPQDNKQMQELFKIFSCAYTNSQIELEPEEHAILGLFENYYDHPDVLRVEEIKRNVLNKIITIKDEVSTIQTKHLGLFTSLGGRMTIADSHGKKHLIFCGIPKQERFFDTDVIKQYLSMTARKGVLSRDWCLARALLSEIEYSALSKLFEINDAVAIEKFLSRSMIERLEYACTFLVDNPVKQNVDRFIPNLAAANVPVIVATGDTAKASENIARVLCQNKIDTIIIKRSSEAKLSDKITITNNATTVIFAGINSHILSQFDDLIAMDVEKRPAIIFSEMTTKNKGDLALHLKSRGYFVVANGDGTNDIEMMRLADFVIGHLSKEGAYAPGISQYVNINDHQVQRLHHSDASFYQLFDIHQRDQSHFMCHFVPLANAQEMVSYALIFKSVKMSFELAKSLGVLEVKEIWNQQWLSIMFDLTWLWIAYHKINEYAYLPAANKHLAKSWLPMNCLLITMAIASLEAFFSYEVFETTTDISLMLVTLAFMPMLLSSFFSGFSYVRDELKPIEKFGLFKNVDQQYALIDDHDKHSAVSETQRVTH